MGALKDIEVVTQKTQPKDGKYEVIAPVSLPDEGTFDYMEYFLEKNPSYVELSDRAILSWCQKSGLWRTKGFDQRSSNDKPEMGFAVSMLDDGSIRRVIQAMAPAQPRNYILMEVKTNLLKDDRRDSLVRWPTSSFKRT